MRLSRWIAAGFGTGWAPIAPGTVASLAAVLAGAILLAVSPYLLAAVAILTSAVGYAAVRRAHVEGDPGWVVIDEFAGQFLSMVALPNAAWPGLLLAFILFRILDITKLGPIGWADRRKDAFGIMADDIVAGLITAGALWVGRLFLLRLLI